jgi:predicted transcriptional regulator
MEGSLKDLVANGLIVKWIFDKQDGRMVDYIHVAKERNKLQAIVNKVMNFRAAWNVGEFLDYLRNCQVFNKDPAP